MHIEMVESAGKRLSMPFAAAAKQLLSRMVTPPLVTHNLAAPSARGALQ